MAATGVIVGAWFMVGSGPLGGSWDVPRLAAAIACAIALTVTANAWNDAADAEIDRVAHPGRPIPAGLVPAGTARRVALAAAALGVGLASLVSLLLGAVTVLVVLLLLAYSPWLKRAGLVGNITAAWLASLPFLYGAWSSGAPDLSLVIWAFPLHFAREIAKDIDDAAGDQGRRRTVPLRWGPRAARSMVVGALLCFIAPIPFLAYWEGLFWALLPAVGFVAVGGVRVIRGAPGAPRALKTAMLLAMVAFVVATGVPELRPFIIEGSMNLFQSLVLGVLQGVAEFLPISSSAHLALAPWLFGWPEPGLAFDVALHVGTLVAVLGYFRAEWMRLAQAAWEILRTRRIDTTDQRRVIFLIVATIPGAIGGLLLERYAESTFRAPWLIAAALIGMGLVLWLVDRAAAHTRALGGMTARDALLVGIAQVAALVPGVSRSGATMTAGRALAFDRESAATFSFLMSMPIIAAAAIFKVPQLLREGPVALPLVVGVLASAVSGWLAIAVLLRYVTSRSFRVFAVYRFALGALVLAVVAMRG